MSLYRAITQGSEMSPRPPHSKAVLNSMFAVLLSFSGPALAQEELEGPGIFSGEKGEFSLSDIFSDKESDSKAKLKRKIQPRSIRKLTRNKKPAVRLLNPLRIRTATVARLLRKILLIKPTRTRLQN